MTYRMRLVPVVAAALTLLPTIAAAACPDAKTIDAMAQAFFKKTPAPLLPSDASLDDAYCAQKKYVALLSRDLGKVVGYKAGLTNKPLQERFGAKEPLFGVMFAQQFLASGISVDTQWLGVRPQYEADLIVTVKDERINEARTPVEALRSLSEVFPYIEILDLPAEVKSLNLATIAAYDIVSRSGVMGKGIPVQATAEFVEALANMESTTTDDTGRVIQIAKGSDILGNPLNVVLWLTRFANAQGYRLRAGDVLSLGAMGRFYAVEAGRTIKIRYTGLPGGDSEAVVTFR